MKKLAIWLCRITGAEEQIRNECYREMGRKIDNASDWFKGPEMVDVENTLHFIGRDLKEYAWFDVSDIRSEVYRMKGAYYRNEKNSE